METKKAAPTAPPPREFSVEVSAPNVPDYNIAVLNMFAQVYNKGDKSIVRRFVDRHYVKGYKSIVSGKPSAKSSEDAYVAICSGIDKKWKIDAIRIIDATPTRVLYTYNCLYPGGVTKCWADVEFSDGQFCSNIFSTDINPLSLDIMAENIVEYNKRLVRIYAMVYNSADRPFVRTFVDRYLVKNYKSFLTGKPASQSNNDAYNGICSAIDKNWTMDDVRYVDTSETWVLYTYSLGFPGGSTRCWAFVSFADGKFTSTSYSTTPLLPLDLNTNLQGNPIQYNAALINLFSKVFNSADKTLLRQFTDRYYAKDYKSTLIGGKPGSKSNDDAYNANCIYMDSKWTIMNLKIVENSPTRIGYTYSLTYPGGTVNTMADITFGQGKFVSASYKEC